MRLSLRRVIFYTTWVVFAAPVWAVPFDSSSGGPAIAILTADGGGDYTSLSEASAAFSGVAGGIHRPWTLQINDGVYIEGEDSFFAQSFGPSGWLTIKPAPGAQPVVDFIATASHLTYQGQIIFGAKGDANWYDPANNAPSSNAFTIDGSNTVGGTSRDLTFQSSVNTPQRRLVRVVGDNDGVVIKNLVVNKSDPSPGIYACIGLGAVRVSALGDLTPDGCVIQNCQLTAQGGGPSGFGVEAYNSNGYLSLGVAIDNVQVLNNTILAKQRGVFLSRVGSATVANNDITIQNGSSGQYSYQGIFHYNAHGTLGWTQSIYNNVIDMTCPSSSGQGITGILLDAGDDTMYGTYHVFNNTIVNLTVTGLSSPSNVHCRGIVAGNKRSNYDVLHNSIRMGLNFYISGETLHRVAGIAIPLPMTTGNVTVKNNIVRTAQTGTYAAVISSASSNRLVLDGNDLFPATTPYVGIVEGALGSPFATFTEWQSAGYDPNGVSVDPTVPDPPAPGVWDSSLHFDGDPGVNYRTVPVGVARDIDGMIRSATAPFRGADEPILTPLTVFSEHGEPVPPVGTTHLPTGPLTFYTAYVPSPATEGLSAWGCTGFTGTGVVPAGGSTPSVGFVASSTVSSTLTWHWQIASHYLDIVSSSGTVHVDGVPSSGGFFPADATLSLEAIPAPGCEFTEWSGDVAGNSNPISLFLDSPKAVTASYIRSNPVCGDWRLY